MIISFCLFFFALREKYVYFSGFVNYLLISCEKHLCVRWKLQLRRVQCSYSKGSNRFGGTTHTLTHTAEAEKTLCTVTDNAKSIGMVESVRHFHGVFEVNGNHQFFDCMALCSHTFWGSLVNSSTYTSYRELCINAQREREREIRVPWQSAHWFLHQFDSD